MLSDYEKLRLQQLEFLENWYKTFVTPTREAKGHHNFSLDYGKIYALRIDDLVYFVTQHRMIFEYDNLMDDIIFKDIYGGNI